MMFSKVTRFTLDTFPFWMIFTPQMFCSCVFVLMCVQILTPHCRHPILDIFFTAPFRVGIGLQKRVLFHEGGLGCDIVTWSACSRWSFSGGGRCSGTWY